ncbi:MAG: hypothetical protein O3C06_05310 [Bacteroidetes bacterium]|nr:hypothetical protein [Bacteroidota bacterium]MDA1126352.1 hypothetical protein [Bacteroidota bacterium]
MNNTNDDETNNKQTKISEKKIKVGTYFIQIFGFLGVSLSSWNFFDINDKEIIVKQIFLYSVLVLFILYGIVNFIKEKRTKERIEE